MHPYRGTKDLGLTKPFPCGIAVWMQKLTEDELVRELELYNRKILAAAGVSSSALFTQANTANDNILLYDDALQELLEKVGLREKRL